MKIAKIAVVAGALALAGGTANATTFGWGSWGGGPSWSYNGNSSNFAATLFKSRDFSAYSDRRDVTDILRRVQRKLRRVPGPTGRPPMNDVPVPASGLLLMGALGVLALRRRKS